MNFSEQLNYNKSKLKTMKDLKVNDQYRTNPMSHQPGGHEVTVVYEDGLRLTYDKVKKPGLYVKSITSQDKGHGKVMEIYVDLNKAWDHTDVGRNPWDI
jgi:hypothetical protein